MIIIIQHSKSKIQHFLSFNTHNPKSKIQHLFCFLIQNPKSKIQHLLTHSGFRRYFTNTSWLFVEQVLRMIAGFLVGVWVARYLGPEKYGIFNYSLAFVAIFAGVAKLGLDGIVIRELVKEPEKKDLYLGTAFWLKFVGAFVVLFLIAIGTLFTNNDRTINLYIFIIAAGIFFQSFEVVDFYFQSKVLSKFVSICKIIQLILSSLLKIYFVLTKADLIYFVLITLIDQITLAITLFLSYSHYHKHNEPQKNWLHFLNAETFNFQIAKNLLKDSWPLILVLISATLYERIDQIMIKEMLSSYSVGIYSAAVKISGVSVIASPIFAYSFFPALVNARKRSYEEFHKRLIFLYSFVFWFSLVISFLVCYFSADIINLLYGDKFKNSSMVLSIYIFTSVFAYIGGVSSRWYIIENMQNIFSLNLFLSVVLNILLNLILIPKYNVKGAAIASLITFSFSSYFSNLLNKKTLNNFRLQTKGIYYPFRFLLFFYNRRGQ